MAQEKEKYLKCEGCGSSILEQCAIEEEGKLLCGDCIVNTTKKEVVIAEKISKEKRDKEYEIERNKIIAKKKKNGVLILIVAIIIFIFTQWLMSVNQPEPVDSISVDYSKNLYAAKALISIALHEYVADRQNLPASLKVLVPHYLPQGFDSVFKSFKYKRQAKDLYELEIITVPSNLGGLK